MKKKSLLDLVRNVGAVVIVVIGVLLIALDIGESYRDFHARSEQQRAAFVKEQKAAVKLEVTQAVQMIRDYLAESEKEAKERVKIRTSDGYVIAGHIYRVNKGKKSDAEIQAMIVNALRPIRFYDGTGYYFITRFDGVEILFADRPQLEGKNLLPLRDTEGRPVIRDMIAIAAGKGEGFYHYRWTKPGQKGDNFEKMAFVKRFEPYDWFIGTGLYLDDVEKQRKKTLLPMIGKVRFGSEGYLFVNKYNGDALVSNGRVFSGQDKLWDAFPEDREGMKKLFAQEFEAARTPGGGYISYSFRKLNSGKVAAKTSFVLGIPELQWIVGGGFYADEADGPIGVMSAGLKEELRKRSTRNAIVIAVAILIFLFIISVLGKKVSRRLNLFLEFFGRSAHSDELFDRSQIYFDEFDQIADHANRMLADKRDARSRLIEEKEKLAVTLQSIGDAVISTDSSGRIDIMNSVAENLTGLGAGEAQGKPLTDVFAIVNAKTGEAAENPVARVLERGQIVGLANHTKLISRTGAEYQIADSAAPIRDRDGNITGVVLVFRDVTGQYCKDEQLRRSEENLRAIFDAAKNVAFIKTSVEKPEGEILQYSAGAENIFGYSSEEAVGKYVAMLHLPEDAEKFPAMIAEMAKNRIGFNGEITLVRKSGEEFPALLTTYPLFDANGVMVEVIGITIDISKQKEAEAELLKMEKLCSIGTLAGGLAHDFNNIMMGLFGNISLARMKLEANSPALSFIEKAEQSLDRATALTNQLLTFAKGGAPLREEVSLPELVEQTVRFDLSGSSVKAVFTIAPDLWKANVDRGQMHQVFSNLTINAKQAMPEGGILKIAMDNSEIASPGAAGLLPGKYLKITVADQGSGIDSQNLSKIFDPYFTTRQGGRGLGLATVYSIVAKHGGLIEAHSLLGQGTTFTLHLPALEGGEDAPTARADEAEHKEESWERLRILLMDDEEMVRQVVREMLEVSGFEVETAGDGDEALELYRRALETSSPFDGVIMDLTVPGGMGGKEAVRKLLEIDPEAKAIVSSGYAEDPIMAAYEEYGFKGVIAKPYKIVEMKRELARIFEVRSAG